MVTRSPAALLHQIANSCQLGQLHDTSALARPNGCLESFYIDYIPAQSEPILKDRLIPKSRTYASRVLEDGGEQTALYSFSLVVLCPCRQLERSS